MRTVRHRAHARLLVAAALLAATLALAGCSNPSDQERIEELEEQVAELQASQADQGPSDGTATGQDGQAGEDAAAGDDGGSRATGADAAEQDVTDDFPELADFDARAAELEAACQDAAPSGDRDADYRTYLDIQHQLDELDREMDAYEDDREYEARTGDLSREDYRRVERALDLLDDRLDRAENELEYNLGIDD